MIVSKQVNMIWNNRIKKYYEEKGYIFTHEHDSFLVKIEDLMPTSSLKVSVRCDICGAERKSSYYIAFPRIKSGNICNTCASRKSIPKYLKTRRKNSGSFLDAVEAKYGKDYFEKHWSQKNTLDPSELCRGSKKEVWIRCQEKSYHDDYLTSCKEFVAGRRCPQCHNFAIHTLDSLGKVMDDFGGDGFALSRWSKKNAKSPYEHFPNSSKKVWLTCPNGLHDDYLQIVGCASVSEFRCPMCTRENRKSRLQEKVETYITDEYAYEMLHEYDCSICPRSPFSGLPLRYDIEVVLLKLIIEVHGAQHYKFTSFRSLQRIHTREEEFEYQKQRDNFKEAYAIEQGYNFLVIPYTAESDDLYKILIDNAIQAAKGTMPA